MSRVSDTAATIEADGSRLQVAGAVSPDTVVALRARGEQLIARADAPIVIDLGAVTEPHTVVLSLALCWLRAAQAQGKALTFESISQRLHSLAVLGGVTEFLPGFTGNHQS